MASSSSVPRFPEDIPINIYAQDSYLKDATMNLRFEESKLVMEIPIDFEALKVNGHDYKEIFTEQGWGHYLDMLNGPIYSNLVFDFWRKSEVVTLVDANAELQRLINQNPSENKGKSREELGLRKFTETEIRSSVGGFQVILTRSNLAKMLNLPNTGMIRLYTAASGRKSVYLNDIVRLCFKDQKLSNKVSHLNDREKVFAKILLSSFLPRDTGSDSLNWDQRHFIYFLSTNRKMNLPACLFQHLCETICEAQKFENTSKLISHPRLLSFIFEQLRLPDRFMFAGVSDDLEQVRAPILDAKVLTKFKPISDAFIFDNEPPEVILEYMRLMKERGTPITHKDIGRGDGPTFAQIMRAVKEEVFSDYEEDEMVEEPSMQEASIHRSEDDHPEAEKEPVVADFESESSDSSFDDLMDSFAQFSSKAKHIPEEETTEPSNSSIPQSSPKILTEEEILKETSFRVSPIHETSEPPNAISSDPSPSIPSDSYNSSSPLMLLDTEIAINDRIDVPTDHVTRLPSGPSQSVSASPMAQPEADNSDFIATALHIIRNTLAEQEDKLLERDSCSSPFRVSPIHETSEPPNAISSDPSPSIPSDSYNSSSPLMLLDTEIAINDRIDVPTDHVTRLPSGPSQSVSASPMAQPEADNSDFIATALHIIRNTLAEQEDKLLERVAYSGASARMAQQLLTLRFPKHP
ncbi:hypothetical protein L195_g018713 [Trifolium pratense]|uniref:Uncharacterized protein n=1 Tax=Trifolium pratense TaxID=57577 RepID=A0A2K3MXJ4_TRIPR|nr:hypothetical protein L195_g018713 [Trifolium pratense]